MTHAAQRRAGAPRLAGLTVGALGVVYGDIGTSPLYAIRESFEGAGHELAVTEANVLGVLSLILWSLVVVITVKYLLFVMRASNEGEGGILALTSLVTPVVRRHRRRTALVLVGLFGTALLYGDGMITPAISVLSAVEGTTVATTSFEDYVVPLAVVILVGIFAVQHRGTAAVGRVFGPVMVVWFTVLGTLGAAEIAGEPGVLRAVSPTHAFTFFVDNGTTGLLVLGSVFLVVTGGEALYADMGHFGRAPIAIGWLSIAFPGLLLNYFGQGALLLSTPEAVDNPFYRLAPSWSVYPMVVLATCATIIASQALISGAFSLTMQATQLGYAPRVRIRHTSGEEKGQIYVPAVNWMLMVACVGLVLGFRSSTNLAAAYGVAVTITMAVTTVIFYVVAREHFEWSRRVVVPLCALFFTVDLAFLAGNLPKIPHGGWFPLVVAAVVFTVLTTWQTGRRLVGERLRLGQVPLVTYLKQLGDAPPVRVPGTAVYLYSVSGMTPPSLMANVRANHVLHERVLVVSVVSEDVPRVESDRRLRVRELGDGVGRVDVRYGFMESPDLGADLAGVAGLDPAAANYFLGKETIVATQRAGMAMWRERLFGLMLRNAASAADYFRLPPGQIVELGTRVEL